MSKSEQERAREVLLHYAGDLDGVVMFDAAVRAMLAFAAPGKDAGTGELVDRLRALLAKATPGPWHIRTLENFGFNLVHYTGGDKFDIARVAKCSDEANAALIVEAINALPTLLDRLSSTPIDDITYAGASDAPELAAVRAVLQEGKG